MSEKREKELRKALRKMRRVASKKELESLAPRVRKRLRRRRREII